MMRHNPRLLAEPSFAVVARRTDRVMNARLFINRKWKIGQPYRIEELTVTVYDADALDRLGLTAATLPFILVGQINIIAEERALPEDHDFDQVESTSTDEYRTFKSFDESSHTSPGKSAARKGYGPLLYDVAATVSGRTILPSIDLSEHSAGFWSKQTERRVEPLTESEFYRRYGQHLRHMLKRGVSAPPELQELGRKWVDDVVGDALAQSSTFSKPSYWQRDV